MPMNPTPGEPNELAELFVSAERALSAGRLAEAETAYRKILTFKPGVAEVHNDLGSILAQQGRLDEAQSQFELAVNLKPDLVHGLTNLGNVLGARGKFDEAIALYERALALRPDSPMAHNNLGNAWRAQGKFEKAQVHYELAVALAPDYVEAYNNLGFTLGRQGKLREAVPYFQRALALRPDFVVAHYNLGNVLKEQQRLDEAAASYRHAVALAPNHAGAHYCLASVLRDQGRLDQSLFHFDRTLELEPDHGEALYGRASLKTFRAADPEIEAMEVMAAKVDRSNPNRAACIHFALGKAYDDAGEYSRAFSHLLKGNSLKRGLVGYDEPINELTFRAVAEIFDRELLNRFSAAGDPSPVPIFVLGMPRSGSTLIEQILASHPSVHGAGELTIIDEIVQSVEGPDGRFRTFPAWVLELDAAGVRKLGQKYLAGLPPLPPGKTRITDKAPSNFLYAALIRMILPKAKIIHTVRDPVDTCLSCFSQLFTIGQSYTYDLAELGRYYRRYNELMDQWRSILPAGTMLDVRYEDVVDNLEEQARRLIDFCGLPWDDRCLSFHQFSRPVTTASNVQVRQPIYRKSVQRWRRYEKHLGPLLDALAGKGKAKGKRSGPSVAGQIDALAAATRQAPPPVDPLAQLVALADREHQAGRLGTAEQAYRQIIALKPEVGEMYNNLGNVLMAQGRPGEAKAQYEQAVARKPNLAPAHVNLGNILSQEGKPEEAIARYRLAIAIQPNFVEAHNNLGVVLRDLRRLDEAAEYLRRALALRPDYAEAHFNLGCTLNDQDRLDEAVGHFRADLAINPNHAEAHSELASALSDLGRIDEAATEFQRALALKPDLISAHYDRASITTFRPDDPELAQLEAMAANPARVPPKKRVFVHFALGKALQDVGQYDRAFAEWQKGSALKRREIEFDLTRQEQTFRLIRETFDAGLLARLAAGGNPSPTPIFILGMPRSGSTLIEQILASHPAVQGAGELETLGIVARSMPGAVGQPVPYPQYVPRLETADLGRLAEQYLAALPALCPGKTRMTDKMPRNFIYLGLIHLILPHARIIHTVRNPIDTCLSCFSSLFTHGQPFTYDLAELGRYYRGYHELMDHWRSILPAGAMLDVRYEDVVDNLEVQARRLIDDCGLPWDDRCLNFHQTDRPITTASSAQVRRPIYRSSLERWRRYEKHLGPLLAELSGLD